MPGGSALGGSKNFPLEVGAQGANLYIPSLATSSLKEFYDDVVYWEILKGTNKFFVTFERGQYATQNNKQESIGTMEITHPKVDLSSGSGIAASASLGGSRNNVPFNTFFQNDEDTNVDDMQHHGYNGFICLTELRGTRFFETTITSSLSKPLNFTYEIANTEGNGSEAVTRSVIASYFYPFTNYQFSVLRKSPTLILDLDFDSELPSYAGVKGFAVIPNESHEKIKDNFEYYLEKAGLLTKTVKFKSPKKGI
jgi:hypothetical protein